MIFIMNHFYIFFLLHQVLITINSMWMSRGTHLRTIRKAYWMEKTNSLSQRRVQEATNVYKTAKSLNPEGDISCQLALATKTVLVRQVN